MSVKVTYINARYEYVTKVFKSMMDVYKELGIHNIVFSEFVNEVLL